MILLSMTAGNTHVIQCFLGVRTALCAEEAHKVLVQLSHASRVDRFHR